MSTRKPSPLAERLAELSITADELAAIVKRDPAEVAAWIDGSTEPDAEAAVLLRVLDDDADALRRVQRVRNKRTQPLKGDDWQTKSVDIPYGGGYAGADAGRPE